MATKKLAKSLGLIQKCSTNQMLPAVTPITVSRQEFDYIFVLDFESTCWDRSNAVPANEVIEFPVVLLELATGKILSEFQQYVFPTEHPKLSEFCTNLTGITQSQVDNGVPLGTAIALFSCWVKDLTLKYQIVFNQNTAGKHAAFATWSDWDLGICLHYECKRKQINKPLFFRKWIDMRATYKKFYQRSPQGLAGALQDLGIHFEGQEHSGICDARNTALLAYRMAKDGCILIITKDLDAKPKII